MKTFFDWEPTPDPKEFCFWVIVGAEDFYPADGVLVEGETTYGGLKLRVQDIGTRLDRYSDWVYMQAAKPAPGFMQFFFGKPKTEEEKLVPFEVIPKFRPFSWPSVLQSLEAKPDYAFPRSTYGVRNREKTLISGPSYYIRANHIEGGEFGTHFTVERFLSPTKFNITRYRTPVPTTVSYDIAGRRGMFPRCLHDKLVVEDTATATDTLAGTTAGTPGGVLAGQVIPPTNMTTWQRYVVECDQQQLPNGLWLMERIWAHPPPLPDAITTD